MVPGMLVRERSLPLRWGVPLGVSGLELGVTPPVVGSGADLVSSEVACPISISNRLVAGSVSRASGA